MSTKNRIVSVVDDDLDITQLFYNAVRSKVDGISVVCFNDPAIALEHFTDNRKTYALVISDLRMLALNGMDLIKKVKKVNPFVRTILMTAFTLEDKLFQDI